jgi:STE24 endopeptidase
MPLLDHPHHARALVAVGHRGRGRVHGAVDPRLADLDRPLFNTYRPVADPAIRDAVLQMAKADGVPVTNVYEFDASRQTTRVSANVSGIFGSAAVRLNDNLLKCTPAEIRAVMGHELGHYVLNHIYKLICEFALLFLGRLPVRAVGDGRDAAPLRRRIGLAGCADVAGFPLLLAVFSTFLFLATPILNTLIRTQEIEADRFGLNLAASRTARPSRPEADEYRKPDPGAFEEFVFFDHPSTRFRIHDAMRWRERWARPDAPGMWGRACLLRRRGRCSSARRR